MFSKPPAEKLMVWFEQQPSRAPRSGRLADTIRYALSRWDGLTHSCTMVASSLIRIQLSVQSVPSHLGGRIPSDLARKQEFRGTCPRAL
jgi:hypothetical protein